MVLTRSQAKNKASLTPLEGRSPAKAKPAKVARRSVDADGDGRVASPPAPPPRADPGPAPHSHPLRLPASPSSSSPRDASSDGGAAGGGLPASQPASQRFSIPSARHSDLAELLAADDLAGAVTRLMSADAGGDSDDGALGGAESGPAAVDALPVRAPALPQQSLQQLPRRSPLPAASPARAYVAPEDKLLKRLPDAPVECTRLPDGAEPAAVEVEYPPRAALQPLADPGAALAGALADADSADWAEACRGLTTLRRLAARHAGAAAPALPDAARLVLKSVRSARSALAKTALLAACDLLESYGDAMLPLLDVGGPAAPATSLLAALLLKAASTDKRFVVDEAQRALAVAAERLSPGPLVAAVLPHCAHKAPKVRGRAAVALAAAAARLPPPGLAAAGFAPLLRAAGALVTDNTPDARDSAKRLVAQLRAAFDDAGVRAAVAPAGGGEAPAPAAWAAYCAAQLTATQALAVAKVA